MADRAKKISELTALATATGDDLLVIVDDPSGNAVTKSITVNNLLFASGANNKATSIKSTTAPAQANSTGVAGEIRYDSSYIYLCTSTNTWKRSPLSTW